MENNNTRCLSPSAQEALRIRSVKAALKADTQTEVCKFFGISRTSLIAWLKTYKAGGFKALKAMKVKINLIPGNHRKRAV